MIVLGALMQGNKGLVTINHAYKFNITYFHLHTE